MEKYRVKNKDIRKWRNDKREIVISEIQGYQQEMKELLNTSINRNKFLNKFYLYMGFAKKVASESKMRGHD